MNYLKKQISVMLFFLTVICSLTICNTFVVTKIIRLIEDFEPVVMECVVAETESPVKESVQEEVLPEEDEVIQEEVSVYLPIRINCRLDDKTQQMILEQCEEADIAFPFVMAVIFKESSFHVNADSGSSVGLMQINRINHNWLSKELGLTNFFDPEQNVKAGLHMLNLLFDKYQDPAKVLMAYNMGESGAKNLWKQGIYTTDYAEGVLQQADKYQTEINERMGVNDHM